MLKDITLGQYFPGDTLMHRLDPRAKLLITILYIAALFTARSWLSLGIVALCLALELGISRIRLSVILRGLKPVLFVVVITAVINLFYGGGEPLVSFWIFSITRQGIRNAVFLVVRILLLISGTFMLTYTTSPLALTDAIELLLGPLKRIRVPVHELAMMMSIALRFIPTLIEETDKIMSAQKARGANFETGTLPQRAKALLPLLVPLFVSAFRRADELAVAMECRCYHGGDGRTRLNRLVWHARDSLTMCLAVLVLALITVLRRYGL